MSTTADTRPSLSQLQELAASYAHGYAAVLDQIAARADEAGDTSRCTDAALDAEEIRGLADNHRVLAADLRETEADAEPLLQRARAAAAHAAGGA
jgi:hypothetical protein